MNDILIKNGLVYDGTGRPAKKKDILIWGDKIVALDKLNRRRAETVIDTMGGIVIPGIIDINTDSDHFLSLFSEPRQFDFIKQGVTTVIGGNCGASLAPLLDGSLVSLQQSAGHSQINIGWRTVKEFLNYLEKRGIGVNFGTLVGYTTIRRVITQDQDRDLTEKEINFFKNIIVRSLKEGAFGFSTGSTYLYDRPYPYREINELVRAVAEIKGIYAAHLRETGNNLLTAIQELITLVKKTKVNLEINHFQPIENFKELYSQAKDLIEKESHHYRINFDCYPFESMILPISALLPRWAGNDLSEYIRQRLLEHFRKLALEKIIIGRMPPPLQSLNGKTLLEFGENANLKPEEALLRLMRLTNLKALIILKCIDSNTLNDFMLSPQSIISSNGAALPAGEFKHERNFNTFPKFLNWAGKEKKLSLEKAVAKITGQPAQKYGLIGRGLIKEGNYADIAVFHNDYRVSDVIINGRPALIEGRPTEILAGRVLRKKT